MPIIPEERGLPILGSARDLAREPQRFIRDIALRHGGICAFSALHHRMIAVSDPDLVHELLVTKWQRFIRTRQSANIGILARGLLSLSGDEWLERRRLAQTAFTKPMLKGVAEVSAVAADALVESWDAERARDGSVDLEKGMLTLSMSVIAQMLLSSDIPKPTILRIGETLRRGLRLVYQRNTSLWSPPMWIPTARNRALLEVRREITQFTANNLGSHIDGKNGSADLLTTLKEARDPRTGNAFSAEALIEEAKTLFFTGYETASTGLTWAIYLLAHNPDVARKARQELDRVLAGRAPSFDDLPALPYLRAILQETMRVYPPVYALARAAVDDEELGGYAVSRGTVVIATITGMHHIPAWGADHEEFRPERFLTEDWPRRAFMPYGAGRHLCIGADFANVEMAIALAVILQRYRLHTSTVVEAKGRVTQVPDRPIRLVLEPVTSQA